MDRPDGSERVRQARAPSQGRRGRPDPWMPSRRDVGHWSPAALGCGHRRALARLPTFTEGHLPESRAAWGRPEGPPTPLLIGVLGLGIGGHEREERIDRLVIIQSGSLQSWLVARMIAVSAIAGLAVLLLCLGAGLTGGASLSELGALAGLGLVYTALWGGLLLVVSARSRSVRAGAFAFGSLWTVLCVLLPTLGAEVGLGRLQADYALSETLEARALTYDAYEQELGEATEQLYALYPELRTMQAAADEVLAPAARRHVYDGLLVAGLSERHRDRAAQAMEAQQVAEAVAWLSPPVALTLALERLAGVGPDAASAYASYLVEAVEARVEWLLLQAWGGRSLGLPEFDALIAQSPAPFEWRPVRLLGPGLLLGAWLLLGWVIGARSLRQSEQPG